jgi:hypothetical protein
MPLNLTKINCITLKIRSKAEFSLVVEFTLKIEMAIKK